MYAIVDHDLRERLTDVEEFLDEHVGRERRWSDCRRSARHHEALQPAHLLIRSGSGGEIFRGAALEEQSATSSTARPAPGRDTLWTAKANPESLRILAVRRKNSRGGAILI